MCTSPFIVLEELDADRDAKDKLWLVIFRTQDGSIRYGCRGPFYSSPRYQELYQWLNTVSYKSSSSDMPWDYFYFTDPKDELEFINRYEAEIISEE